MPETTTGPARIAAQTPAAPSPTPGTPETDPADLDAIAARNAHRRCHHCDMPLDDDQRCINCGSETPDDIGALVAEVRRLRTRVASLEAESGAACRWLGHALAERDRWRREAKTQRQAERGDRFSGDLAEVARRTLAAAIADAAEMELINGILARHGITHRRGAQGVLDLADTAGRDGAADALAHAAPLTNCDDDGQLLIEMAARVRSGERTIPTGGGDLP